MLHDQDLAFWLESKTCLIIESKERLRNNCKGHVVILQVVFGRLLIATGSRARRINDDPLDSISKGLQVCRVCKVTP